MRKLTAMVLILCLVVSLCACGQTAAPATPESKSPTPETAAPAPEAPEENLTDVQKAIREAASLSSDQLLEKAKAEIGDNELHVYGTTSRVNEESFTEKTGIKLTASNPNDSQIYELLVLFAILLAICTFYPIYSVFRSAFTLGNMDSLIPKALELVEQMNCPAVIEVKESHALAESRAYLERLHMWP